MTEEKQKTKNTWQKNQRIKDTQQKTKSKNKRQIAVAKEQDRRHLFWRGTNIYKGLLREIKLKYLNKRGVIQRKLASQRKNLFISQIIKTRRLIRGFSDRGI